MIDPDDLPSVADEPPPAHGLAGFDGDRALTMVAALVAVLSGWAANHSWHGMETTAVAMPSLLQRGAAASTASESSDPVAIRMTSGSARLASTRVYPPRGTPRSRAVVGLGQGGQRPAD